MKDNTFSWMSNEPSKGSTKFSGNQSGKTALTNAGRGPTVGNKSNDATPGSHAMPAHSTGKDMTLGCHHPQVRNPGGTKEMPSRGKEKFNYGRGPTKGNA